MTEENPIIEEIRRTREMLLARHNGDLNALVSELQHLSEDRNRAVQPGFTSPDVAIVQSSASAKKVG